MCLYTKQQKPLVAKRDIICLKYLYKDSSYFYTPYQHVRVRLDKEFTPNSDEVNIKYNSKTIFGEEIFNIGDGVIHARLIPTDDISDCCKKAIIPKGTEYYLSALGDEIAARTMIITSEEVNEVVDEGFLEDIIDNAPSEKGVYVGDYLLEDGSYARPNKLDSFPIGQVVGFYKHKPLIAAVDILQGVWDKKNRERKRSVKKVDDTGLRQVATQFNGEAVTKKVMSKINKDDFMAFTLCHEYHSDCNEQWYLPAVGEMVTMLNNIMYINAARKLSKVGLLIEKGPFWTSSKFVTNHSWYCELGIYDADVDWASKNCSYNIIPFLASSNKLRKKTA